MTTIARPVFTSNNSQYQNQDQFTLQKQIPSKKGHKQGANVLGKN